MKLFLHALAAVWLLFLAGCQTGNYVTPVSETEAAQLRSVSDLEPGTGVLIGSFSFTGGEPSKLEALFGDDDMNFNSYSWRFRATEAQGESPVRGSVLMRANFLSTGVEEDFEIEGGKGVVFMLVLPAGRYEFFNYSLYFGNGMVERTYYSKNDFSLPFEIEEGRALYIGEIRTQHLLGKNGFGVTVLAGGIFEVLDSWERDQPLLTSEYPILSDLPVDLKPMINAEEILYPSRATQNTGVGE